jgi:hypothetical protein
MNKINVNDYLTKEEIQQFLKHSDLKAVSAFIQIWLWIAFAFIIAGLWPNPFTKIIAMVIFGRKQFGLCDTDA